MEETLGKCHFTVYKMTNHRGKCTTVRVREDTQLLGAFALQELEIIEQLDTDIRIIMF